MAVDGDQPRLKVKQLNASSVPPLQNRIAAQIIERARQQQMAAGVHLGEQDLADAFRVSRSPVRVALQMLEQLDLVERRPNHGYFLRRAWTELEHIPLPANEQAEDELYYQIAEDRLSGALGARFTEREVMRHYGVTRARLTRILTQMSEEGWLERLPGHGWEFQTVLTSASTYEQSYRFRAVIEPLALLEPGYTVNQTAFDEVRAEQESMLRGGILRYSNAETFRMGTNFHETLVAGSGNIFFIEGIRRVNRLRRLFEYRINKDRSRLVHECKDHLQILDLIEGGKNAEAADFLRGHLTQARDVKLGLMDTDRPIAKPTAVGEERSA
jgi:DNA-binding GntR family transcriptional regulator